MFKKSRGYLFVVLLCIVSVFSLIFSACKEGGAGGAGGTGGYSGDEQMQASSGNNGAQGGN